MVAQSNQPVALIIGAGDAIGSAISEKFAENGHVVCMARRNSDRLAPLVEQLASRGLAAHAFSCDARDEEQVVNLRTDVSSMLMGTFAPTLNTTTSISPI